jgi:hypothetical protein
MTAEERRSAFVSRLREADLLIKEAMDLLDTTETLCFHCHVRHYQDFAQYRNHKGLGGARTVLTRAIGAAKDMDLKDDKPSLASTLDLDRMSQNIIDHLEKGGQA